MNQDSASPTYMFVFRSPEDVADPSPEEMQRSFQKWMTWIQGMRAKGQYLAGEPLEDMPGKVLRGSRGAKLIDGPFAEAKEVVCGFMLIKADSFEHAAEIARDCPGFDTRNISVEVRQIKPMAR